MCPSPLLANFFLISLQVLVKDNGNPSLSSSCVVEVQVKDYNDNPPVFSKDLYEGTGKNFFVIMKFYSLLIIAQITNT